MKSAAEFSEDLPTPRESCPDCKSDRKFSMNDGIAGNLHRTAAWEARGSASGRFYSASPPSIEVDD